MSKKDKQPTCFDDYDPHSLSVEMALDKIFKQITIIKEFETCGIRDALNRVLATNVESSLNVPSHTNSAMDGYAINGNDLSGERSITLEIVGKVFAGSPISTHVNSGQCVRIMTGGKMPTGTDTVIMQEHVTVNGNFITITPGHKPGQNVRQAGEDIAIGQTILSKGKLLTSADIGLLASLGIPKIEVVRKLRVAFFSTGNEIVPVGTALDNGQIYDSNRYTLHCMLTRFGADITDLGIVTDEPAEIEKAFSLAAQKADVIITTGGVSVGEADYVKSILEKLGEVNFWKVAMKPGRPLAYGRLSNCQFFGLPGNPVSAMVTFYQIVLPALKIMSGQTKCESLTLDIPTTSTLKKNPGRVEFQRGIISRDMNGLLTVQSTGRQGSGILSSMSVANCFIILPSDVSSVEPGEYVKVQPFDGLI